MRAEQGTLLCHTVRLWLQGWQAACEWRRQQSDVGERGMPAEQMCEVKKGQKQQERARGGGARDSS